MGEKVRRKSNGQVMEVIGVVDADYAKKHCCTVGQKICTWGTPARTRPFRKDEIEHVPERV